MGRHDRFDHDAGEIHDLEALRARPWLRELRLGPAGPHASAEHPLDDHSPLAELRALEVLEVPRSRVADLSPLAGLAALRRLDVSRTRVADLAPLAGLARLAHLDVAATPVSDLGPLRRLTSLAWLGLRATGVADLSPVADLPAIRDAERLDVSGTRVSSLAALGNLQWVRLSGSAAIPDAVTALRRRRPNLRVL